MSLVVERIGKRVFIRPNPTPDEIQRAVATGEPTPDMKCILELEHDALAIADGNTEPGTQWVLTPIGVRVLSTLK